MVAICAFSFWSQVVSEAKSDVEVLQLQIASHGIVDNEVVWRDKDTSDDGSEWVGVGRSGSEWVRRCVSGDFEVKVPTSLEEPFSLVEGAILGSRILMIDKRDRLYNIYYYNIY